jgi:hypothetical protein
MGKSKQARTEKMRARVLLDHDGFAVNQIVEGADAERGHREGWADPHPSAVAYARKLASRKAREAAED